MESFDLDRARQSGPKQTKFASKGTDRQKDRLMDAGNENTPKSNWPRGKNTFSFIKCEQRGTDHQYCILHPNGND